MVLILTRLLNHHQTSIIININRYKSHTVYIIILFSAIWPGPPNILTNAQVSICVCERESVCMRQKTEQWWCVWVWRRTQGVDCEWLLLSCAGSCY